MAIWRDILMRFTVASFLVQLLLPFFASYGVSAAHAAEAAANPAVFGERVLICTRDGFQWVSWEALANDEETRNNQHRNLQCPTCYVQAHGMHMLTAVEQALPQRQLPTHNGITPIITQHHAIKLVHQHAVRAPPAA